MNVAGVTAVQWPLDFEGGKTTNPALSVALGAGATTIHGISINTVPSGAVDLSIFGHDGTTLKFKRNIKTTPAGPYYIKIGGPNGRRFLGGFSVRANDASIDFDVDFECG
jgi:hypothetical protein